MKKLFLLLFFPLVGTFTTNGQWFSQYVAPFNNDLFSVKFFDTQIGWVVGNNGAIYKTLNGGTEWYSQESSTSECLNSVHIFDQSTAWIVGNGGTILKTTDGGSNWGGLTSGTTNNLHSVCFIDANTGWAAGDEGTILKTINAGINWSTQVSGDTNNLNSVYFTNQDTGWACSGENGIIVKTTNGGTNWFPQSSSGSLSLYSIFFIDSNIGWAVGYYKRIIKTTNGGISWIVQSIPPSGTINIFYSVHFIDQNNGWAVGDYGAVVNTTNGGLTWANQSSPFFSIYLFSVCFANKYIGWAVGDGIIRKTINGGGIATTSMLITNASAGGQILEVAGTDGFSIGNNIDINPGGVNEETNTIAGFGSILLQTPLQFNHQAGELIVNLTPTSVKEIYVGNPKEFTLSQNYPNPFNPSTTIKYSIPKLSFVTIKIYDVLGSEVAALVNEEKPAGTYEITWYAEGLPSGVFFYQLRSGSFVETKKMLLLK